jgi:hypothetical protein
MNIGTGMNDVFELIRAEPGAPQTRLERRGPRRFSLSLEMKIVDINGQPVARMARTRNMSSGGGVSFLCGESLSVGSIIRYFVTLAAPPQLVRLSGAGRVVRCIEREAAAKGEAFEIAVTMDTYQISRE